MALEAIKYERGSLKILDQLRLPHVVQYQAINSSEDAWSAIRDMRVRGAPAIAIVAALGLAVELHHQKGIDDYSTYIGQKLDYLVTSRPTAVNLARAVGDLKSVIEAASSQAKSQDEIKEAYIEAAAEMLQIDVGDNVAIGDNGAKWIKAHALGLGGLSVVTHCNTGSLATAGYGTALGVIRSLNKLGCLKKAFCSETRPYNQGSRLTAFELVTDSIPACLVTDSMVAALLQTKGPAENISAIVVGADRVAANGDTANKIGTYALAILARQHGVKFVVAAPRTTIDMKTHSGYDIKIEERAASEMTTVTGPIVAKPNGQSTSDESPESATVRLAAQGIEVWNPAFDVTPYSLIDAIVTEVGVCDKDSTGAFDLQSIMKWPLRKNAA